MKTRKVRDLFPGDLVKCTDGRLGKIKARGKCKGEGQYQGLWFVSWEVISGEYAHRTWIDFLKPDALLELHDGR